MIELNQRLVDYVKKNKSLLDRNNFDKFFQIILPEMNEHGEIIPSNTEKDVCQKCFRELYWKIPEIKHSKVFI